MHTKKIILILVSLMLLGNCTHRKKSLSDSCITFYEKGKQELEKWSEMKEDTMHLNEGLNLLDSAILCDSQYVFPYELKTDIYIFTENYNKAIEVIELENKIQDNTLGYMKIAYCAKKLKDSLLFDKYRNLALEISNKRFEEKKSFSNLQNLIVSEAGILSSKKAKKTLDSNKNIISNEEYQLLIQLIKSFDNNTMDKRYLLNEY